MVRLRARPFAKVRLFSPPISASCWPRPCPTGNRYGRRRWRHAAADQAAAPGFFDFSVFAPARFPRPLRKTAPILGSYMRPKCVFAWAVAFRQRPSGARARFARRRHESAGRPHPRAGGRRRPRLKIAARARRAGIDLPLGQSSGGARFTSTPGMGTASSNSPVARPPPPPD